MAPVSTKPGLAHPLMRMVISLCGLKGVYGHRGKNLLGVPEETESNSVLYFKAGQSQIQRPFSLQYLQLSLSRFGLVFCDGPDRMDVFFFSSPVV